MKTLMFPHPPVRHALLEDLTADQVAQAFFDAWRARGQSDVSQRLAYPLRLSLRLLDSMSQENLEFALLSALKEGRPLDQGLELEWRWNLWHLLGVWMLCRDAPQELTGHSDTAQALLGHFKAHPSTLDELLDTLHAVAESPTVWPGINLDAGPAPHVALTSPTPDRPFWEHLVFQLTAARRQRGTAGELRTVDRWQRALLALRQARLQEGAALPAQPTLAPVVYLAAHRR